jgi:parallel beta-helix repeat protein
MLSMRFCVTTTAILVALAALAIVTGCGSDKSSNPAVSLSLDLDSTAVELCATLEITADVASAEDDAVTWYVNGILGGNTTVGTISQANPATYSAPEAIPAQATVTVSAVSDEDTTKSASGKVTVRFTMIHVDAATGSDETGTGCVSKPFKTITHGLGVADPGMTVLVADGIYDGANGEVFNLVVPGGVTLLGESQAGAIIRMDTAAGSAVALSGNGPRVRRFTIDNGGRAHTVWAYAVYVDPYAVGAALDSVTFTTQANSAVIRVLGAVNTTVTNCRLVAEPRPLVSRGFELVVDDAGTVVRNCVISGFIEGIFLNNSSNALIEACTIEDNLYGVDMCCYSSATSNPAPDLGGGPRGSLGGNIIRNNATYGLHNPGTGTVYAKYNTWSNNPPVVGCAAGADVCNDGPGATVLE